MFLMNLFIGVIFYNFEKAHKLSKDRVLSDNQMNYLNLLKEIISANPNYEKVKVPDQNLRKILHKIVTHKFFEFFSDITIILSLIILSMDFDNSHKNYRNLIIYLNTAINLIFIFEVIFYSKYFLKIYLTKSIN